MSRVSVVVPSYNSAATVTQTLDALLSQTKAPAEIIVADSSDDGVTRALLGRDGVRLIPLPPRTMPGLARNEGARRATGEILAFVDSDAVPEPDWVERIEEAASGGCQVGGGAIDLPGTQRWKPVAIAQHFLQFNEFMPTSKKRSVAFAPSCNLFCRRELFKQAGEFPPVRASEDVLFGFEASKISNFYFLPEIRVRHIFRENVAAFLRNQMILGRYVLVYRRLRAPRAWFYRGLAAFLLSPFVMIFKGVRITCRVFCAGPTAALEYVLAFPFFLLGLLAWGVGFAREAAGS